MELVMFTKMLKNIGGLPIDQAARYISDMGFAGADLTVREGGHVLPEEAANRLPEAVEMLKSKGLSVPMITTNITDANERHAEEIFKTASECGVKYIKLGYWRYRGFGTIRGQIERIRDLTLMGINELSKEYSITAGVHIHSGDYMSAEAAVLRMLLENYDPEFVCAYIDPGHMAVEGGLSGWRMGMDLLQEYIRMVAVKDFGWFQEKDEKTGLKRWRAHTVPLSEGLVPWQEVFKYLRMIGFDGPVSVHSEYRDITLEELIRQTRQDLQYLKGILEKAKTS